MSDLSTAAASYDACFIDAGARYRIAPGLLQAIARTESGLDPAARNTNRNGSVDVGLMQINSRWLSPLAKHGINKDALWDPCLNIHVGAWILAQNIARYGYTWTAVGAYNAGTGRNAPAERRRRAYAARVARHLPRRSAVGLHDTTRHRYTTRASAGPTDCGKAGDHTAAHPHAGATEPLVRHVQPVSDADRQDARRQQREPFRER